MYLVIVLLVLHTWEFTNSMDSQEIQPETDQEEQLIPFDFEYSVTVKRYLKNKTTNFQFNKEKKLFLGMWTNIDSFLNLNFQVTGKFHIKINYINALLKSM